MKKLLPLIAIAISGFATVHAQTRPQYTTDEISALIGEDIAAPSPVSATQHFENIRQTWLEDIRMTQEYDGLTDETLQPAFEAIDEYTAAAQTAYNAQMEFALYSLAPIKETHPQRYQIALQQYSQALLILYKRDARIMRASSVLTPYDRAPEITPMADAFCSAIYERGNESALGGAGYRGFVAQSDIIVEQQLKLKQDLIIAQLDTEGDFSLGREFISNSEITADDFDYDEYRRVRAEKFKAAEAAWETYSWAAARLLCPIPVYSGTGTGSMISAQHQQLVRNHELFLILLMRGIREK